MISPVSNRATWYEAVRLSDQETGDLLDLTDCSVVIEVAAFHDGICRNTVLSASTDTGAVTIPETGIFEFRFEAEQMRNVVPGVYRIGATISRDGETAQIIIGNIRVIDGVVR
jgi:hypothetical protein